MRPFSGSRGRSSLAQRVGAAALAAVFGSAALARGVAGKGMFARNLVTDEAALSPTAKNNYTLVKQSPSILGALQSFNWNDLEPSEGVYDFSSLDTFIDNWAAYGKRFAFSVNTSPNATPEWVYTACSDAGSSCKITGVTSTNVYPVYWNASYQAKYNALIQELSARYASHPNLELVVMAGFGHGITENIVDKDKDILADLRPQFEAVGICTGLTTVECDAFFSSGGETNIDKTPYMQAILTIRNLWRTAWPYTQLVTRVHEVGDAGHSVFETTLRNDSLANNYALTNDGGSVKVSANSRNDLLNLSQTVKVGWISWTGREKKAVTSPTLSQVEAAGAPSTPRTYYGEYTWIVNGGESTPSGSKSLTVSPGNVLVVTIPSFETEVTSANVYVGTSATIVTLQESVTVDGGTWTERTSGITTGGAEPPTENGAFGTVLDLYHHTMGIEGDAKLSPSAHVSYLFRDMDSLIQSVPGTSTYVANDPEKFEEGLTWAHTNFWPGDVASLVVDPGGNGVLEIGETAVVAPSWTNAGVMAVGLTGTAANLTGPVGLTYTISDTAADYGTILSSTTSNCLDATGDCYAMAVTGPRPVQHLDLSFDEVVSPTSAPKTWTLHVGESFTDVPATNPYYPSIETILHHGVTAGCGGGTIFCPLQPNLRRQMAVFLLKAFLGSGYTPPACTGTFSDVPCPSTPTFPFSDWIEDLSIRGITAGCASDPGPPPTIQFCPDQDILRREMAVFLLKASQGPGYTPPACTGIFSDVPCPSTPSFPYSDWIEDIYLRGITAGCSSDPGPPPTIQFCPGDNVTRQQMAVFLTKTFSLVLYAP